MAHVELLRAPSCSANPPLKARLQHAMINVWTTVVLNEGKMTGTGVLKCGVCASEAVPRATTPNLLWPCWPNA